MKKSIVAVVCCLMATSALANPHPTQYISLIVNGVRFFFSESIPKEIVVHSNGTGKTKEEAVNNALISAIQKGLGVLVVTDDTVSNDRVIKNIAAQYSSGVVNSYEVKNCSGLSMIRCEVQAKVSPWKFQRKLESDSSVTKVNGENLYAQHMSMQYTLIQRKKLTEYYLSQVRQSGLEVKVKEIKVIPTMSDTATISYKYEVRLNPEFKKNLIAFLQKLEKDTNGQSEQNHQVYIQWASTGWSENRVFINAYDQKFKSMIQSSLSEPFSVGVKELNICEQFFPPDGNIIAIDWYGFHKQRVVNVPVGAIRNLNTITVSIGC